MQKLIGGDSSTDADLLEKKRLGELWAARSGEFSDKPPKPADIPASPKNAYAADWQGWGDFLGSGNVAPKDRVFRPFEEARAYVRTLGFRTGEEYRAWHKATRPADLPASPNSTYSGEGFVDWQDFLQAE